MNPEAPPNQKVDSNRRKARAPASRPTRGERSRETILDAAVKLFAQRGYYGVSLDDVTVLSGAKRALILYHFKSKNELWRAAAERAARVFNGAVQAKLERAGAGKILDPGRHSVSAWLDAFIDEPEFARFLVLEGGEPGPRLDWLIEHYSYSSVPFASPALRRQLSATVLRDALMAIFLSMSALAPLMEASLSKVSGNPRCGIYPLSRERRDELIDLLLAFMRAFEAKAEPSQVP